MIYQENPFGDCLVRILKSQTVIPPVALTAASAQLSGFQTISKSMTT